MKLDKNENQEVRDINGIRLYNGLIIKYHWDDEYNEIYFNKFIENVFDNLDSVKLLTDNDLKEIGINKLGHRKLILKAIQNL